MKLTRKKFPSGKTVYYHPNGYTIKPEEREWSERGTSQPGWNPKRWWEVKKRFGSGILRTFDKLGEARDWCDANP